MGEKLVHFVEAPAQNPDFARELPRLAAARHGFQRLDMTGLHVATMR